MFHVEHKCQAVFHVKHIAAGQGVGSTFLFDDEEPAFGLTFREDGFPSGGGTRGEGGQGPAGWGTGSNEPTPQTEKGRRQGKNSSKRPGGPGDNDLESPGEPRLGLKERLGASRQNGHALQPELPYHRAQERSPPAACLHERQVDRWLDDLHR